MNWKVLFRTKSINHISSAASHGGQGSLKKTLGVWDLTAFGVAAILGAGIFSTIGTAAFEGGPAVVCLFIFTAIACGFSALCYAEFASAIPMAGSAYSYAYATFGELVAWIIGWDLLLEYAISNIVVAISWSRYFTGLLAGYGIHIPHYLTMDYLSASRAYDQVTALLAKGQTLLAIQNMDAGFPLAMGYHAWLDAPRLLGIPMICDLPALVITFIITGIVYVGIEESRLTSNFLVLLKVVVVLLVIAVGAVYVQPENWVPFAPQGMGGVLKGVSAVFFAYIGFDAISTSAEECKNPQRDLPRGMIYSLIVCTVLYALVALVLTGMVNYRKLGVGDPLAFVFGPEGVNLKWVSVVVNVGGIIALSTVLLVYQLGQPRIWLAMSRDGLLPPIFSAIHPKFRTPWFSTLLTGVVVAVPSLFMNLTEVTDLTSIGTLFAFLLVCGGCLRLKRNPQQQGGKFRIPYFNSKWVFPALFLGAVSATCYFNPTGVSEFLQKGMGQTFPMFIYLFSMLVLSALCFSKNLSLIPVLGLATCGYLITELGVTNWLRFGVWLCVGFFIYFLYGIRHSHLRQTAKAGA